MVARDARHAMHIPWKDATHKHTKSCDEQRGRDMLGGRAWQQWGQPRRQRVRAALPAWEGP